MYTTVACHDLDKLIASIPKLPLESSMRRLGSKLATPSMPIVFNNMRSHNLSTQITDC